MKFYNNKAGADGGDMYTNDNCNVVMKGNFVVIFNNNVASGDSGGVYSIIMNSSWVFSTTLQLGMPRYSIFHVLCHGELCHDMLYVTT